jgi:hypothetical protein
MSTKNVNGNEDYRELTACQRLLDYYEEAYKQISEAHRWASVTSADLAVGSVGIYLENDIESLKERIAILERRLYNLE